MPADRPETTRWEVFSVPDGTAGRGDIAAARLENLLKDGWEPFGVSGGLIWLRRLPHMADDQKTTAARSGFADVFDAMGRVRAQHKATGAYQGEVECPACGQALQWSMAPRNKHVRAACVSRDCVTWME